MLTSGPRVLTLSAVAGPWMRTPFPQSAPGACKPAESLACNDARTEATGGQRRWAEWRHRRNDRHVRRTWHDRSRGGGRAGPLRPGGGRRPAPHRALRLRRDRPRPARRAPRLRRAPTPCPSSSTPRCAAGSPAARAPNSRAFLDGLATEFDFVWYFEGTALHVSPPRRCGAASSAPRRSIPGAFVRTLTELEIYDPRFDETEAPADGESPSLGTRIVIMRGTPRPERWRCPFREGERPFRRGVLWPAPSGGPVSVLVHDGSGHYGVHAGETAPDGEAGPRPPPEPAADSPSDDWGAWCCSAAPALDDDLRLGKAVEDLPVEQLVAELGVEALAGSRSPMGPRLDVGGPGADGGDPVPHRLRHELRAVVGPDVIRHAAQDEQIGQDVDDVVRSQLPSTRIARHSRVNSSMRLSMRNFLPSWVRPRRSRRTRRGSDARVADGCSDPSLSQSRLFFGCFWEP